MSSNSPKTPPFDPAEIVILPMTKDDLFQAATVFAAAFPAPNAFFDFLQPKPMRIPDDEDGAKANKLQAIRWEYDAFINESKLKYLYLKAVRKGQENKLLGVAIWGRPGYMFVRVDKSKLGGGELDAWKDSDDEHYNRLFVEGFQAAREEVMEDQARTSWYLKLLAIDPKHQRMSIGQRLLDYGLDLAAKDGVSACLEASPDGKPLYEKRGFRVEKEVVVEGMPEKIPFMVKWAGERGSSAPM